MALLLYSLSAVLAFGKPAFADFLGPSYPQPVDLTSNSSAISAAWRSLRLTLDQQLKNRNSSTVPGLQNVTFSVGMFSLNDANASSFQYHYTSAEVKASPNGTHEVDDNSIYAIASITKLFTVLTGLLELNDSQWKEPISKIYPGIVALAEKDSNDTIINTIQWDKITAETLASQISGLPTNPLVADILVQYAVANIDPTTKGYPPLSPSDRLANPPCLGFDNTTCFLPQIAPAAPNHLPWADPVYSNNNFIVLTAVLQNLTGKSFSSMLKESVTRPLNMSSTFGGLVPPSEWGRSVILDPQQITTPAGVAAGAGGITSTINDLNKFGVAILNSTLLPKVVTRKWMKPITHTGRLQFSFGKPWEILRYTHASGHVTDLYTKAGDAGTASSFFVAIPNYNAGFNILGSSTSVNRNEIIGLLADHVGNVLLPALESQAAAEAERNFAGRYESIIPGLNSSLTLSVNKTKGAVPGLFINSFINNGTDFQEAYPLFFKPGARLQPAIKTKNQTSFRVATDNPAVDMSRTLFSKSQLDDYIISDATSYGGVALSLFVFDVDECGQAATVSPAAWRDTLKKT